MNRLGLIEPPMRLGRRLTGPHMVASPPFMPSPPNLRSVVVLGSGNPRVPSSSVNHVPALCYFAIPGGAVAPCQSKDLYLQPPNIKGRLSVLFH